MSFPSPNLSSVSIHTLRPTELASPNGYVIISSHWVKVSCFIYIQCILTCTDRGFFPLTLVHISTFLPYPSLMRQTHQVTTALHKIYLGASWFMPWGAAPTGMPLSPPSIPVFPLLVSPSPHKPHIRVTYTRHLLWLRQKSSLCSIANMWICRFPREGSLMCEDHMLFTNIRHAYNNVSLVVGTELTYAEGFCSTTHRDPSRPQPLGSPYPATHHCFPPSSESSFSDERPCQLSRGSARMACSRSQQNFKRIGALSLSHTEGDLTVSCLSPFM